MPRRRQLPMVDKIREREDRDAVTLYHAGLMSKYLPGGKLSPGLCFAYFRLNEICSKHRVLRAERERCLKGLSSLAAFDSDLIVEATLALKEMENGFRKVPKVADILANLAVAARTQAALDRLLAPKPRKKIIIKRPV